MSNEIYMFIYSDTDKNEYIILDKNKRILRANKNGAKKGYNSIFISYSFEEGENDKLSNQM